MCLEINRKYHKDLKPLIARRDIYTLKVVKNSTKKTSYSYIQERRQPFKKVIKSKLLLSVSNNINIGLHSLVNKKAEIFEHVSFDRSSGWPINRKEVILCKIPKNSLYYIGKYGDIVSNQLINLEVILANSDSKIILNEKISIYTMRKALKVAFDICESYKIKIGI